MDRKFCFWKICNMGKVFEAIEAPLVSGSNGLDFFNNKGGRAMI